MTESVPNLSSTNDIQQCTPTLPNTPYRTYKRKRVPTVTTVIHEGGVARGEGPHKEAVGTVTNPPHITSPNFERGGGIKTQSELGNGSKSKVLYKKSGKLKKVHKGEPQEPAQKLVNREKTQVIDIKLSKRQGEAFKAEEKFVLYGGAKGGGKSWFLCVWMFLMAAQNRGNKLFFCRKRSVDFTNTTLETWKKAIPANLYRINEQKKKIYVPISDSVVDYGGLDDPLLVQSLNSAEYAHIGVDQGEEIEQDSFAMLRGTLRHRLADGSIPKYQIRITANPAQCWLKDLFILRPQKDFRFIPALPTDNPHLPPDYVENLSEAFKHRPQLLAAYLHGSWDDLAGSDLCIQSSWIDKAKDKIPEGKTLKRIVVNDPARFGDDENVIYVMEQRGNVISMVEEIVLEHKSLMDTAGRLTAIRKKHDAQIIAVDVIGIGSGIVDALNEIGEPVLAINSSAKPTIESNQTKYFNLRSQIWLEAGKKFADGHVSLHNVNDLTLSSQLNSVKYDFAHNGRQQVESKDEIKKRLGRSPDRGDAFVMGIYAIEYVERLDAKEYESLSTDRQGSGERILPRYEEFVGCGDDVSGYNF